PQAPQPPQAAPAGTVSCGNCQSPVRVGSKFCGECGTALNKHCTNCNADLSPTAKFCGECGTPANSPQA
ncbi:MAG: zinc ribbon domain-containing protein, partial [Streptosporangiaceae bacterium]